MQTDPACQSQVLPPFKIRLLDDHGHIHRLLVTEYEPMTIYGVEGFAVHKVKDDEQLRPWRVSHIETGFHVGWGPTKQHAVMHALKVSQTVAVLTAAIDRGREKVKRLEKY